MSKYLRADIIEICFKHRDVIDLPIVFSVTCQSHTRADNVHDGIDSPYFVEMDLLRRKAMNLSFGEGYAMKNRDGFFFDPIREAAGRDQLLDFREVSAV